ncbi:NnrS family protein [Algibacillus agarilyticus]|uniref:NnrS family protein n=1 Tax=Algibacillus agarilyticus TaxID=2234133 RepID=UPI000DD02AD3|nr:NnrS family protein [Algibacillus agarilyticus]
MIQINEPNVQTNQKITFNSIFALAFRSFFLLATIASVAALVNWSLILNGMLNYSVSGLNPVVWHLHEMLFGFAATVAAGFLLTAVQTWTGLPSIQGTKLALLVVIWLSVRAAIWVNTPASLWLAMILQFIWWLSVIATMSRMVWLSKNKRNYLFVPLLLMIMMMNVGILLADMTNQPELALHIGRVTILLFVVMMTIVGGRVIPFFTARGAQVASVLANPMIEIAVITVTLMGLFSFAVGYFFSEIKWLGFIALGVSGILQLIRIKNWHTIKTLNVPLLWSLHLAYICMIIGLVLFSLSAFITAITLSSAIHTITIGAISLMIFAMMARVSLGHTGRPLQVSFMVSLLFICIVMALIARVVLPVFMSPLIAWNISVSCWGFACLLFLWRYLPILLKPRLN